VGAAVWAAADSGAGGSDSTWLASAGPVMAAKAKISNQLPVFPSRGGDARLVAGEWTNKS
jgi:hypothetical protein